jgi:putative transposase
MAYPPRNLIVGRFYHLYNRGNHRDSIFHCASDYERFLWALTDAAAEYDVEVAAYCLMPNHYHVLVRLGIDANLSAMMSSCTISYTKWFNRRYGQVGHLFQGRYRTRAIENDADLMNVSRYIHRNPIELGGLLGYEWSSYRAYLGEPNRWCEPDAVLKVFKALGGYDYEMYCNDVKISEIPGGLTA